jgi:hypothetical protein
VREAEEVGYKMKKGSRKTKEPRFVEFSMEYKGKTRKACYSVDKGVVTVHAVDRTLSTQLGGARAAALARLLLAEIVEEAEKAGS